MSQLTKSTLRSAEMAEYIIDVPNIAFEPKISGECMGWRWQCWRVMLTGNADRYCWPLHQSTVIICIYHVTRLGPITIAYFGQWYNNGYYDTTAATSTTRPTLFLHNSDSVLRYTSIYQHVILIILLLLLEMSPLKKCQKLLYAYWGSN